MSAWNAGDLGTIGTADELEITSWRADGTLRRWVTIWVVRTGDQLFVRSARGADNPWYRWALVSGSGRIRAGGIERDVTFADASSADTEAIDAAYHQKYDKYPAAYVNPVVGPAAAPNTLELLAAG